MNKFTFVLLLTLLSGCGDSDSIELTPGTSGDKINIENVNDNRIGYLDPKSCKKNKISSPERVNKLYNDAVGKCKVDESTGKPLETADLCKCYDTLIRVLIKMVDKMADEEDPVSDCLSTDFEISR